MPLPAPVINATLPWFVSVLTAFSLFAGRRIIRVRAHMLSHHTTADCSSQTPWLPRFPPCAGMVEVRDVPVTWRHVAVWHFARRTRDASQTDATARPDSHQWYL